MNYIQIQMKSSLSSMLTLSLCLNVDMWTINLCNFWMLTFIKTSIWNMKLDIIRKKYLINCPQRATLRNYLQGINKKLSHWPTRLDYLPSWWQSKSSMTLGHKNSCIFDIFKLCTKCSLKKKIFYNTMSHFISGEELLSFASSGLVGSIGSNRQQIGPTWSSNPVKCGIFDLFLGSLVLPACCFFGSRVTCRPFVDICCCSYIGLVLSISVCTPVTYVEVFWPPRYCIIKKKSH